MPDEISIKLTKLAAALLRGEYLAGLSPYRDDMPKSTPASVMRSIAKAERQQCDLGMMLKSIADVVGRMRP